jgi:hypothetical protein
MSNEKNALVVKQLNMPVRLDDAAMAEEMDGLNVNFDLVKFPSGGALVFEVPGEDAENPDSVKEIVGVIVDHHPVNAYWVEKFTGQNNHPDCASLDGKIGEGNPGGNCKACPLNKWGSDTEGGKGKACKNIRRVYMLQEGKIFPLLLRIPPTSLQNFSDYISKRILQKGYRSFDVITKVTLKKAQSSGGIAYSQAMFSIAGLLDDEAKASMAKFSEELKTTTRSLGVLEDEYYQGEGTAEDDYFPG